jgi:hypothetical protein
MDESAHTLIFSDPQQGLRLLKAYWLIGSPKVREAAIRLVERLAQGDCERELLVLLQSQK